MISSRLTPWHVAATIHSPPVKQAIVVGAGLAGSFMAYSLAKRGIAVTLIDAKEQVAYGASGNMGAVLYPQFSPFSSPLTQLMLSAYLYAVDFYKPLIGNPVEGELQGILQFFTTTRERRALPNLEAWLKAHPQLGAIVDAGQASELAGITLNSQGLYIRDAGWINSRSLCEQLVNHPLIHLKNNTSVKTISYEAGLWNAGGEKAEILILASGYETRFWPQTQWLPIKPVSGQMTLVTSSEASRHLKIPLCGQGHILPARNNSHILGASFHTERDQYVWSLEDDAFNLARLQDLPIAWDFQPERLASWGGVRAATPDYMPLVGPVVKPESFLSVYAGLAQDARRFIPATAEHYPGLYVCAGFGSRGLTTIPLCAQWLVSQILEEPSILPDALIQALSPSRYLRKQIIQGKKR